MTEINRIFINELRIIIMNAGRKPTEAGHSVARLVCEFVFGLAALSAKDKGDLFCEGFYWSEATDGNFSLSFLSFGFYCFTSVFLFVFFPSFFVYFHCYCSFLFFVFR
jgi:hypothetical protein